MQLEFARNVEVQEVDGLTKSPGLMPMKPTTTPVMSAFESFVSVNADNGVVPASGSAQKLKFDEEPMGGAIAGHGVPTGGVIGAGGVSVTLEMGWPKP